MSDICPKDAGSLVNKILSKHGPVERITNAYKYMDETVTQCMNDCNELGKIEICADGENVYLLPCKLRNLDCGYGEKYKHKAKTTLLNMLKSVIPEGILEIVPNAKPWPGYYLASRWDWNGILYLHGSNGTGKSTCAAWLIYNIRLRKFTEKLDNEVNWWGGGIAWASPFEAADKNNFDRLKSIPVLVIDDLGSEAKWGNNYPNMAELISKRYDSKKSTVITSNSAARDLPYERRVIDRLLNDNTTRIEFKGASIRTSAA